MIAIILSAFAPVFAVIAIGYSIRAAGWMPRPLWAGINTLNHRVLLPSFLFVAVVTADLSNPITLQLAGASALSTLSIAAIAILVSKLLGLSAGAGAAFCATACQWNFVSTFALTERLAGTDALVYSAIILVPGLLIATTVTVASFTLANAASTASAARKVLTDPLIIAGLSGLVLNPILPETASPLLVPLEIIGAGSITVVLLAMGAGLDFGALKGKLIALFSAAALRTIGGGAVALAIVLAFGFRGDIAIAFMIAAAAPAAAFIYAVAADLKQEPELTAAMITLSVMFSAIITPIAAAIALSL